MAARTTRIGGRNPEQAGQAAWLATEKVVRPSTRPERQTRHDHDARLGVPRVPIVRVARARRVLVA
jgi:hypothetical protein